MGDDILERIVAAVRRRLADAPARPDLESAARKRVDGRSAVERRSLREALERPGPSVIAECKHASPSAGVLREPFDPVGLAEAYVAGGARAVSVVTEPDFFGGDPGWIAAVRDRVPVPVLRKDFVVTRRQLLETVLLGADGVLLINRLLSPGVLADLVSLADELRLEVLLELFLDEDPDAAVAAGAPILGLNARDLATFEIDLEVVAARGPELSSVHRGVLVAESGVRGGADVRRLHAAGYDGFLVGEHLVRSADPTAAVAELLR